MNKKTKAYCFVAFGCLIIGAGLVGAGFAKGGSLGYLQINKENTSWWPFDGSIGINTGRYQTNSDEKATTWTARLSDHKKYALSMDLGDIEIKKGDTNQITFKNINKDCVTIDEKKDEATINVDQSNLNNIKDASIHLTLKDQDYNLIVKNHAGDVQVDQLDMSELDVNCDLGDIDLKDISVENKCKVYNHAGDVQIDRLDVIDLDVNCDLGDIELEDITIKNSCKVYNHAGDIDISGLFNKTIEVGDNLGDVTINLKGEDVQSFDYEVSNSLGDTMIGEEYYEAKCDQSRSTGKAKKFTIHIDSGDIYVF